MSHIRIDPITDQDIESVVDLWDACGLLVPWNDPRKDIAFARAQPNCDVLVGHVDGRIAAAVMVGHDGHRGNVYYVAAHPELRGEGHGRAIMAAAEDWLKARGVRKLNIMVRGTNIKAVGFYKAIGAEREDRVVLSKRL